MSLIGNNECTTRKGGADKRPEDACTGAEDWRLTIRYTNSRRLANTKEKARSNGAV